MTVPYRIHLLGFSDFERSALSSYLRLAAGRTPAYVLCADPADAEFLVVDADDPAAMAAADGRGAQSVLIGATPPTGGGPWTFRPIDPLHVLRALDMLTAGLAPIARAAPPFASPGPPQPLPARRASDPPR